MIGAIDDVRGMAIAKKQRLFKMSNYPMQNTIAIVMRSRVTTNHCHHCQDISAVMAMINGAIHPITMRSIAIAKVQPKG